ncbi:nickel transport system ATP-binding protein [Geomicrobium halophilum]|uniref:Nickel transport system ATP-binding protein n=1 Tax=Geomicrobium halophilum TaxID=549000 RepID=A0A841PXI6_9BACL|nr:ABC transporter ATP-binding protein [Geomicrobium halophilum]MBB6448705.1 nickel transport system ATP-binding protein [Geomicrobium halophilum]
MLNVDRLSIFTPEQQPLLQNISFTLSAGKTLGVIGESGAGKTMLSLALMRLLDPAFHVSGGIYFQGKSLMALTLEEVSRVRGKEIGFLTQHPLSAFDPIFTVGKQMLDTVRTHFTCTKRETRSVVIRMLDKMAFEDPEWLLRRYPFELSGGMLQRVMIALMMALKPKLMIADEPTTALDTVTQQQVLHQLGSLRNEGTEAMLLITHDLGVLAKLAEEVLVIKSGLVVERLSVKKLFAGPEHTYTRTLLRSHLKFHGVNA